jgi:hypothetical protein
MKCSSDWRNDDLCATGINQGVRASLLKTKIFSVNRSSFDSVL